MARQPCTAEECTLCLEAYIAIRDSKGSFSVSNPVLISLRNYLEQEGVASRSIDSVTLRIINFRYQDTGTGCSGISNTALSVWKKYLDESGEKIDTRRLRTDCEAIRASIRVRRNEQ